MRWPWLTITLIGGYLWWCWRTLFANRGMMPFKSWIDVFEPEQRALLAWDGHEEIMVLSTDLYTSQATDVLEIMPLPSEPSVSAKDIGLFHRLNILVSFLMDTDYTAKGGARGMSLDPSGPPGQVTFHQQIGAHDISVAQLLRKDGFIRWAEDYLRSAGMPSPHIAADLATIVEEYIDEGFTWFVFDVISSRPDLQTNEPIQYRFRSERLYYPLRITRTARGKTKIDLCVLTCRQPDFLPQGIARSRVRSSVPREHGLDAQSRTFLQRLGLHNPNTVEPQDGWLLDRQQLAYLDQETAAFFQDSKDVRLLPWRIEGELSAFDRDLLAA